MGIFRMDMKRAFLNKRFVLIVLAAAILWYWNSRRFFLEMDVLGISGAEYSCIYYYGSL